MEEDRLSFDPQVFDDGLFGALSFSAVFDSSIFDRALFDTGDEVVEPEVVVVRPGGGNGGRFQGKRKRPPYWWELGREEKRKVQIKSPSIVAPSPEPMPAVDVEDLKSFVMAVYKKRQMRRISMIALLDE